LVLADPDLQPQAAAAAQQSCFAVGTGFAFLTLLLVRRFTVRVASLPISPVMVPTNAVLCGVPTNRISATLVGAGEEVRPATTLDHQEKKAPCSLVAKETLGGRCLNIVSIPRSLSSIRSVCSDGSSTATRRRSTSRQLNLSASIRLTEVFKVDLHQMAKVPGRNARRTNIKPMAIRRLLCTPQHLSMFVERKRFRNNT
jgi:hypothetical protein